MTEITRYTYLNLDNRPDRRLLAACTAWRDGIPRELVHFWTDDDSFQIQVNRKEGGTTTQGSFGRRIEKV